MNFITYFPIFIKRYDIYILRELLGKAAPFWVLFRVLICEVAYDIIDVFIEL
jgi:hypothetical protein